MTFNKLKLSGFVKSHLCRNFHGEKTNNIYFKKLEEINQLKVVFCQSRSSRSQLFCSVTIQKIFANFHENNYNTCNFNKDWFLLQVFCCKFSGILINNVFVEQFRQCVINFLKRSFFWSVYSHIQSEYGKIRPRKNSVFGLFSCNANNFFDQLHHEDFLYNVIILLSFKYNQPPTLFLIIGYHYSGSTDLINSSQTSSE